MNATDELNADALELLALMEASEKTMPDDFLGFLDVRKLAALTARAADILSEKELAILLGVGALLIRIGKQKMPRSKENSASEVRAVPKIAGVNPFSIREIFTVAARFHVGEARAQRGTRKGFESLTCAGNYRRAATNLNALLDAGSVGL